MVSSIHFEDLSLTGEEIVISGISGLFPSSDSVSEFMDNLYNKLDMVSADDMNFSHPEAPKFVGKTSGSNKFDAQFFKVTYNQAVSLEPSSRKIIEQAYSAMYDAGINPLVYSGKKIGVYAGSSYTDSSNISLYSGLHYNPFIISGSSRCMLANRTSYFLDGKSCSYSIDSGCTSAISCLTTAYNDIKTGICEAALVAGCQICLHPFLSLNLKTTGMLSIDGKTKCFDKHGDGYVRADAVNVLFLQKAKCAKRIYAEVCHAKVKYGLKPDTQFLQPRRTEDIKEFLEEFYSEAGVSQNEVEYVEAHGSALPEEDANELEAISEVFAEKNSVMVGCVKSNMGNSEAASGACALTKLCLAYQKGKIAANIHYNEPLDIPAIREGKVKILTDHAPFNRGYTAINNFSFNGVLCHVLLKGHFKQKDTQRYNCNIPRLILVSGRDEDGVEELLDIIKNQPINPEVIGMLHDIYQVETPGHTCRGFIIVDTNEKHKTVALSQSVEVYQGGKRPLWLVYSGMGSQWTTMGAELLRLPIFANAIEKCRKVLEPKGVDIVRILTNPDNTIFDSILNCFVGIAAVQIGLTDILKAVGIVPDNIIGHSVGEMGCAYFDDCLTTEEMILAIYTRGKVSEETEFIKGSMAAVGLGYNNILPIIPPKIDVACHNSSESCTISGPADVVQEFVADLTAKGVFAKTVPTANIAYHSRYIKTAGLEFENRLRAIIKTPVERSKKWICTSLPPNKWNEPIAKYSSAEYYANNLMSSVYFEEAAKLIPSDAVVVEVAPCGLLQAILKRSHPECTHIPLTKRGHSDPLRFLFEAFGKLYQEGYSLKIDALYPKIEYPVSTTTPAISHYVKWYHKEDWPVPSLEKYHKIIRPARKFVMSLHDDDYKFLSGHIIEGKVILPEAAIIFLLWETVAMYRNMNYKDVSVLFREIHFTGEVIIDPEESLSLSLTINKGNNYFEVTREDAVVAKGYIYYIKKTKYNREIKFNEQTEIILKSNDIYKLLHLKGYTYRDEFQSILTSSLEANTTRIAWTGNWITFIDALIQMNILARRYDGVSRPKIIKELFINGFDFLKRNVMGDSSGIVAEIDQYSGVTRCCGVEIKHIIFEDKPIEEKEADTIYKLSFIPYNITKEVDIKVGLQIFLQIVADNLNEDVMYIRQIADGTTSEMVDLIRDVAKNIPQVCTNVDNYFGADDHLLVGHNLLKGSLKNKILNTTGNNTFILTLEENAVDLENNGILTVISSMKFGGKILALLKKSSFNEKNVVFLPVSKDNKFSFISCLLSKLEKHEKVVLVSKNDPYCGLFGLVKILNKTFKNQIGLMIVEDDQIQIFEAEYGLYQEQLRKDVVFNIFHKGQWGSYYNIPSTLKSKTTLSQFKLTNPIPGKIEDFTWVESRFEDQTKNMIEVHFAGPSLRDVQKAVGIVNEGNDFGMDFSGIDNNGNRVMGLVPSGALASNIHPEKDLLWPVPTYWSLEEAATVPLPYVLAANCLVIRGQLLPKHSVFVTDGTGALGQAVISLCLSVGCTVYTSVDDVYKKKFLMQLFPQLDEKRIGYSYDASFSDMIICDSKNKRCDFVINNLSGHLREHAMKCVGFFGIFFDLSTYDMKNNINIGMFYLEEDRSYSVVNMSSLFRPEKTTERKLIQKVISEGIIMGSVKPISHVLFSMDEITRAFTLISQNRHRGRVLIKVRDSGNMTTCLNVTSRLTYEKNGTYVVVCDETELGIEVAQRLIKQGARSLVLHLKNKNISGYLQAKLLQWNKLEARVKILTDNLETESGCVRFFSKVIGLGDIYGIFIIKKYLDCNDFQVENLVNIQNNLISDVANLDILSRNNCPKLRHFVILTRSSQNPIDEYATSVLGKICEARSSVGLPALVFRFTLFEQNLAINDNMMLYPANVNAVFNALEKSLKLKYNNVLTFFMKSNQIVDFLNKVSSLIGIDNIADVDESTQIKDLKLNEIIIEELKTAIKINNSVDYTADYLKEMSIARLKSLAVLKNKTNTKFDCGLEAFYKFIEKEEIMASDVLIPMTTLLSNLSIEKEEDIDMNEKYLMLIPGFEGYHQVFNPICERLKIRAVTFQLVLDDSHNSIPQIASYIKQYIKRRFAIRSKFYLMGYSFGVNVALEIASLLEEDGLEGIIYCLDSSPDALRIQLDAYLGKLTDEQLQNAIIQHLFYLFSGHTIDEKLKEEIQKLDNWSDKIKKTIARLKNLVTYTTQYMTATLEGAYKRINLAKSYYPTYRLKSELVLLKGIPHPAGQNLPSDYDLSKYTKKPVRLYNISSDVTCAPDDYRVSNIINQLLEPELLEEFRKSNLCQAYTTAPPKQFF